MQSDEPPRDVSTSKIESDDDDGYETCDAPRDGCGEETRERWWWWWERKVCGWNHKAQRRFR